MDWLNMEYEDLMERDTNDPEVQYHLACCLLDGRGVTVSREEAVGWLQAAANRGHGLAAAKLLELDPREKTLPPLDMESAPLWCMRAEDGDADAQYAVACYLAEHFPGEWTDDEDRYLTMARDRGNSRASLEMARRVLKKDPKQAVVWLKDAQDADVPEAMELLGECYALGQGVEQSSEEAEKWFEQTTKHGGEWMLKLAIRYKLGRHVERSPGKAFDWLDRAVEAGLSDAEARFAAAE